MSVCCPDGTVRYEIEELEEVSLCELQVLATASRPLLALFEIGIVTLCMAVFTLIYYVFALVCLLLSDGFLTIISIGLPLDVLRLALPAAFFGAFIGIVIGIQIPYYDDEEATLCLTTASGKHLKRVFLLLLLTQDTPQLKKLWQACHLEAGLVVRIYKTS